MDKKFAVMTEKETIYFDSLKNAQEWARRVHEDSRQYCVVWRCEKVTAFGSNERVTIKL